MYETRLRDYQRDNERLTSEVTVLRQDNVTVQVAMIIRIGNDEGTF